MVAEPDLVQHQALAVVEAQPQLPVLPGQAMAVEGEADPFRLADLQRRHLPQPHREQAGQVLPHHLGVGAAGVVVFQLEQRHRVQVDDRVQAGDVVGVRVAQLAAPVPDVGPADPATFVTLGDERRAVGPHVRQHQRHVGHAAAGERLGHRGVGAEHLIALVPLVHGHVRLLAGQILPARDAVAGQRHGGAARLAVGTVPADHDRLSGLRPAAGLELGQHVLGRLLQLDRGEPPAIADLAVTPQDRGRLPDLVGRQRIERMRVGH